jgi:hypothetical protein
LALVAQALSVLVRLVERHLLRPRVQPQAVEQLGVMQPLLPVAHQAQERAVTAATVQALHQVVQVAAALVVTQVMAVKVVRLTLLALPVLVEVEAAGMVVILQLKDQALVAALVL